MRTELNSTNKDESVVQGRRCPLCGELDEDFDPSCDSMCCYCETKLRRMMDD